MVQRSMTDDGPASITSTLKLGFSVRRLEITEPASPPKYCDVSVNFVEVEMDDSFSPPTTMKSKVNPVGKSLKLWRIAPWQERKNVVQNQSDKMKGCIGDHKSL